MTEVHIIEPTLSDYTGHCFNFYNDFIKYVDEVKKTLWIDSKADIHFDYQVDLKKHFFRKFRRLQLFFLVKKLSKSDAKIFIPTCTLVDLQILSFIKSEQLNNTVVYIHWFKLKEKRVKRLKKVAVKLPSIKILVPTSSIQKVFLECGFTNVHQVAYPYTANLLQIKQQNNTDLTCLYSGAARIDKGFPQVANYLKFLEQNKSDINIKIQTSLSHSSSCPKELQEALEQIQSSNYKHLVCVKKTLSNDEYIDNFNGAISLMFYDNEDFEDRISGVALDSLCRGAPIICNAGHWIEKHVQDFNAGKVVDRNDPESINSAVKEISNNHAQYQLAALKAGAEILKNHNPKHLAEAIF
jgi:glycosyltransferase involved in cell wall biosynthesis